MFVALCCQLLVPPILGQKHLLRDDHQVRSNAARRSGTTGRANSYLEAGKRDRDEG